MNIFHCDHCRQPVFFENVRCLSCNHPLAYLPDIGVMGSLEQAQDGSWLSPIPRAQGRRYRLCANYDQANVCNWAVAADDPDSLCASCRLTRVIPDLGVEGNKEAWFKLEAAKRRLIYSVLQLRLPLQKKNGDDPQGLAFEFLADSAEKKIFTGHSDGVITINIAEADDAKRELRRVQLHEPYRTLLGHFRHEIGHYYWNVLIENSPHLDAFRTLFGDETEDYAQAVQRHYANGAPADWQQRFISAYATMHPWEDWAESWAHYLHMTDALEMAQACGLSLHPQRRDDPSLDAANKRQYTSFDDMIRDWFSLTYLLNNLNRSMGLPDGYPFVLSQPVIEKLRFIHDSVQAAGNSRV